MTPGWLCRQQSAVAREWAEYPAWMKRELRKEFGMPEPLDRVCLCGEPPYTNGALCPTCQEIMLEELKQKPGGLTLSDIFSIMLPLPEDEDDA